MTKQWPQPKMKTECTDGPEPNISRFECPPTYCPTCWSNNVPVLLRVPCASCEARRANMERKRILKEQKSNKEMK